MMKFLSIAGRVGFFLATMALITCAQTPTQTENHSIAMILKVTGDGEKISKVSLFSYTVFKGRVKDDVNSYSVANPVHIKIKNEKDSLLYENYVQNPLTKTLESFNDDGKIEKVVSPRKEDYVNLRFKLPINEKHLTITCAFAKSKEEESEISTFNLELK